MCIRAVSSYNGIMKNTEKRYFILIGAVFVLLLFAYITFCTPLLGDDWGYAQLGGMSPLAKAIEFYSSWSGRFFSELWNFCVAPNKWIYNIVNPVLFTVIYLCIVHLAEIRNRFVLTVLFVLSVMLSVDDLLRMQTYTWIAGCTYVWPLCLSLLYFCVVHRLFYDEYLHSGTKAMALLINIALFVTGMMMENIAAAMIGGILILIGWSYVKNKRDIRKYLWLHLLVSTTAFLLMRLSPGSTYRATVDMAEWNSLPFFTKLASAYPGFLQNTFINNNYLIFLFSLSLCGLLVFTKKDVPVLARIPLILVNMLGVFAVFSFVIFHENNPLTDGHSLFSMLFWPVYTLNAILTILLAAETETQRERALFYLVFGGGNAIAMLFSPIYGARSAIYTVYYLTLSGAILFDSYELKKIFLIPLLAVFCFILADRTYEYFSKYTQVRKAHEERLEILQYFRENPQVEEAWIPRYPVYTVHSGDVEPEDTYHLKVFKSYYKLPQDAEKIIFYYRDPE